MRGLRGLEKRARRRLWRAVAGSLNSKGLLTRRSLDVR